MGIQLNGNNDNISAVDGDLSITGIVTFSQLDVGNNIKLGNAGVVTATSYRGDGSQLTGISAGVSLANGADNRVITATGAAALNGEANLTFDGNHLTLNTSSSSSRIYLTSGNSNDSSIYFGRQNDTATGGIRYDHGDDSLRFMGYNNSERFRITSGGSVNIGTGELTQTTRKFNVYGGSARVTQTAGGNTIEAFGNSTSGQSYGLLSSAGTTANDYSALFRKYDGTTIMKIRGDGRVGIGEDSPDGMLHLTGSVPAIFLEDTSGTHGQTIIEQNNDNLKIRCDAGNASSGTGSNIRFEIDSSEKMRLHSSGALSVGTSPSSTYWSGATAAFFESTVQNTVTISHSGVGNNYPLTIRNNRVNSSTQGYMITFLGSSAILQGSIRSNNATTSYNSGSDYRLKENIVDISDGITRVKQLQPRRFNWISDENKTVQDGFIAHEIQSVIPEVATGTKDEIVNQEGIDEGSYHQDAKVGDVVYQSVDYGKITPLLTAALKELITKVETLEQDNELLKKKVLELEQDNELLRKKVLENVVRIVNLENDSHEH